MASNSALVADRDPLQRLEKARPPQAKADLKKVEQGRALLGHVVKRCFDFAGVSQKEAAALVDRDQAQIARWIAGTERPQFEAIIAAPTLRLPLAAAMVELAGGELELTMKFRRSA